MTKRNDDRLLEMIHQEEMAEQLALIGVAKIALGKLNVAELRVLMAHYCGGDAKFYSDIRKPEMIEELAPEYARDQLS